MEGVETDVGDVGGGFGEVVGGAGVIPPPTHRGEPLETFHSLPHTTHIENQGGGGLAKFTAHSGSLGERGWENVATGYGPPRTHIHTNPRGVSLAKFSQGPRDAYLPRGEPLAKFSPHPPPPRGTPCY